MKVVFMGTPDFAQPALQALIDSDYKIVGVYTQAPKKANRGMKILKSKIHQLAEENSLKIFTPKSLKDEVEQKKFHSLNADICVVAAYGMILPEEILNSPKHGCINIHPSKLPRWRGAAPIQRTLIAGDKNTEICIMQMDEGLDTGDILLRESLTLNHNIIAGELHDILAKQGAKMTLKTLSLAEKNMLIPVKQSKEGVTYANKITKEDEKINFHLNCFDIHNVIRGLSPYPGSFFKIDGKKYKIFKSDYEIKKINAEPGIIINFDQKNGFEISCKDGSIKILEIQKEGKKKIKTSDFINGNQLEIGTKIG